MNIELPNSHNVPLKKEALDDRWFDRFKKVAAFQDYEYLNGEKKFREDQKHKFLSGEIENPELDYPELAKLDFAEKDQALLALKKDILQNEPNETVRQLYRWRINEKLAELRMLKVASAGNDRRFSRYSQFIYGQPEKEIFDYTLSKIKRLIEKKIVSADPQIQEAARKIQDLILTTYSPQETGLSFPNSSARTTERGSSETECSADEIKGSFDLALEKYKLDGWSVVVDREKATAINVSQERKEMVVPEKRKLKETPLRALIEHEIGTHVLRRETGERSKLKLLGLGLDRYLKGEEGVATYREQAILGATDYSGLDKHLAIALARGLDGEKRTFREVYEILKNYYISCSKKSGVDAIRGAESAAWATCVRTFRGTSCKTPGSCFTKDIVYREGNIGIWNVVRNNPDEVRRFSVGKYDPANPRHIWILDQLGITEEDLATLDEAPGV